MRRLIPAILCQRSKSKPIDSANGLASVEDPCSSFSFSLARHHRELALLLLVQQRLFFRVLYRLAQRANDKINDLIFFIFQHLASSFISPTTTNAGKMKLFMITFPLKYQRIYIVMEPKILQELVYLLVLEAAFNTKLLKKMGYDYVGRNKRIGSDTFIHSKDDNNPSYHKNLTKRINKNLSKGGYYRSKEHDTLKDPPAMGVSWTTGEKG